MRNTLLWIWLQQQLGYASKWGNEAIDHPDAPNIFFERTPDELTAMGFPSRMIDRLANHSLEKAERIYLSVKSLGYEIITPDSSCYPASLRQIDRPPLVLYVCGNTSLLMHPYKLGVIGTRNCTPVSGSIAQEIGFRLCRDGALLVSGCAYGIDSHAHTGALLAHGATIGVLGCGINTDYNKRSEYIRSMIASCGALVSEYPPGTEARAEHFPKRNRIIAGLSQSITLVDAQPRSGSFITAEHALSQGKPVYAHSHFVLPEHLASISPSTAYCFTMFGSTDELLTLLEEQLPPKADADRGWADTPPAYTDIPAPCAPPSADRTVSIQTIIFDAPDDDEVLLDDAQTVFDDAPSVFDSMPDDIDASLPLVTDDVPLPAELSSDVIVLGEDDIRLIERAPEAEYDENGHLRGVILDDGTFYPNLAGMFSETAPGLPRETYDTIPDIMPVVSETAGILPEETGSTPDRSDDFSEYHSPEENSSVIAATSRLVPDGTEDDPDYAAVAVAAMEMAQTAYRAAALSDTLYAAADRLYMAIDSHDREQIALQMSQCAELLHELGDNMGADIGAAMGASADAAKACNALPVSPEIIDCDPLPDDLSDNARMIHSMLRKRLESIETLADKTGHPMSVISETLLELEMSGLVDSLPGGRYATTATPFGDPVIPDVDRIKGAGSK